MTSANAPQNVLYYGDNLDILRRYIKDESVDLIYLDPPFKSNQNYNVLFAEHNGTRSSALIRAFEDTWRWDQAAAEAYEETVTHGPSRVSVALQSFRNFLGDSDMTAYLCMMAPRLIELHRVLKPTGSVYLHCDPTASAHLRLLMDAVFDPRNFVNEIVWYYRGAGVPKKARSRRHDVVLFYAKCDTSRYFDPDAIRRPYAAPTVERFQHYIGNVRGERDFGIQKLHPLGKHPDDVITHIQPIAPSAKARLGYPTQKPEQLLEEFIVSSSGQGDVVLDPFCGCGTAVVVAQRLKRRWIGIDITHLAISLIKHRLHDAFGDAVEYEIGGEPVSLPDAETLAADDPYQFQWWALGLVDARPVEQKKGADKGIDGRLYFHDEAKGGKTKQIVFSVKAGHVTVSHLRDLRGVVERENAAIGVLICLEKPTRPMRSEAASASFYTSPGWNKQYPRLQILTIAELLEGKRLDYPPSRSVNVTFKKAPKAKRPGARNKNISFPDRAEPAAPDNQSE